MSEFVERLRAELQAEADRLRRQVEEQQETLSRLLDALECLQPEGQEEETHAPALPALSDAAGEPASQAPVPADAVSEAQAADAREQEREASVKTMPAEAQGVREPEDRAGVRALFEPTEQAG